MGLWDDIGSGLKKAGGLTVDAAQAAGGALVTEDAWSGVATSLANGEIPDSSDMLNVLLDASIAVPGVGVAGAAARVGGKTAAKFAAREITEAAAEQAAKKTALRSSTNNMIRGKADDTAQLLKGQVESGLSKLVGSSGKRAATAGASKATTAGGKRAAERELSTVGRLAAKKEAGIGTKVGFGQSGKRIGANLALVGGANALETNYDKLKQGLLGTEGKGKPKGKTKTPQAPGGETGQPGTMYMIGADGQQQQVPQSFMDALAAFMKQNGTVAGTQVVHAE